MSRKIPVVRPTLISISLLSVLFIVLKLTGVINWSWFAVMVPVIFVAYACACIFVLFFLAFMLAFVFAHCSDK